MRPALVLALAALLGVGLFVRCQDDAVPRDHAGSAGGASAPPDSAPVPPVSPAADGASTARQDHAPAPDVAAAPAREAARVQLDATRSDAPATELETLEPGGLRVRVVDAAGAPAGGVPVELLRHVAGQSGSTGAQATTRPEDGRARLDLGEFAELRERAQAAGVEITFSVAADVASAAPVRVPLRGWPEDGDEVELALPPMGAARVRVLTREGAPIAGEAAGEAAGGAAGEAHVSWWWVPADVAAADPDCAYERVPEHLFATRAGAAVIEHVGLGLALQLTAGAPGFGAVTVRGVAGPRAAGEMVDVELRLGPALATVMLRVLDAAGSPVANADLQGELRLDPDAVPHPAAGPPRPQDLRLESDASGVVRFSLAPGARAVAPRLDLVRRSPGVDAERDLDWSVARVTLPAALAEGERVDLGETRLQPVPVLAEGVVIDGDGHPVANASLQFLERFGPGPDHRWFPLRDGRHDARADGGFRVRSPRLPRALAVRVTAPGFAPRTFEDVEVGARGLELELAPVAAAPPTGSVRLRVALEPEVLPLALLLKVQQKGVGGRTPDWWSNQDLEVEGLAPGRYDVWVETRDGGLELARVPGVEVRAGEATTDPRLQPFDLRGLAHTVQLEAVRADDTPWRRREILVDPLEPRSDFHTRTDDEGRTTLVLPRRIARILVALEGGPPVSVAVVAGSEPLRVILAGE